MPRGPESCTGCHVCALPCPVFRQSRDLTLTLHGRARALLAGATPSDVAPSTLACILCGACEPVCPETIDTVRLTLDLRRALNAQDENPLAQLLTDRRPEWIQAPVETPETDSATSVSVTLLASSRFDREPGLLTRVVDALGGPERVNVASDGGDDLANRIEAGLEIPESRRTTFANALPAGRVIVSLEGLFSRALRRWRSGLQVLGLGEALLRRARVSQRLAEDDILIVDSRSFHAEHSRLVEFYDNIRAGSGCETNLDLQRVANATGAASLQGRLGLRDHDIASQVSWILDGRLAQRVVVESVEDLDAFRRHGRLPVLHLADLASGGAPV